MHDGRVLVGLVVLAASAVPDPSTLVLQQRVPMAVIVLSPSGEVGKTTSSEIIQKVFAELIAHTDFNPVLLDSSVVKECRGALHCIADKAQLENPQPEVVEIISNIAGTKNAPDLISVIVLEMGKAIEVLKRSDRTRDGWEQDAEVDVGERAVIFRSARVELRDASAAERFFEQLFANELRRTFETLGHWELFGSIDLTTNIPAGGLLVTIDGNTAGTTKNAETKISNVRPGPHTLKLEHPDYLAFEAQVEVARREISELRAELIAKPSGVGRAMRTGLFWTGLTVAAVGAVAAVVAVARDDSVITRCVHLQGADRACEEGSAFQTTGYDPAAPLASGTGTNPSGILLAPLGYSLIGAGGAWALGTEYVGDADSIPWIAALCGVVIGSLAYGISAAVN